MLSRFYRSLPYVYLLAIILWGGFVLLYYLGIDGHIVVLLRDSMWQSIANETPSPFLRGLYGFVPFVSLFLERLSPFLLYGIICLVLYLAYIAYTALSTGRIRLDVRFNAITIILLFIASLWLISTTLYYADLPGMKQGLLIEPTEEVYNNVGSESFSELKANFQRLMSDGCLKETVLRAKGNTPVYQFRVLCVQKYFFMRILSPLLMLLFFVFDFLIVGRLVLWILNLRKIPSELEFILSLGVGAAVITLLLWILAFSESLNSSSAWLLLAAIPIVGIYQSMYWLKAAYRKSWRVRTSFFSGAVLLGWLLVTYLAFNYLTVIRPFPIGWDDLGRYINAPRQMSAFGMIIPGMQAVQWEYLTSLGFVLFGYFSTFGAILAQQVNWMAGLFATLSVYLCTKAVLEPMRHSAESSGDKSMGTGLLAALFYYTLPMVGHFSFADMKTENALFFYGVLGVLCVFHFCFSVNSTSEHEHEIRRPLLPIGWQWIFLAGVLFAAGFATKATIVLLLFLGGIVMTYHLLGNISAVGATIISVGILAAIGPLSFPAIIEKIIGLRDLSFQQIGIYICVVVGSIIFALPFFLQRKKKYQIKSLQVYVVLSSVMIAGFMSLSLPWMLRNLSFAERFSPSALLAARNTITPEIISTSSVIPTDAPPRSRALPQELAIDPNHEMCKGTAKSEELDRYWGFGSGIGHYTGLPWRIVMNRDAQGYYLTTSPLILLIPLLLILPYFWRNRSLRLLFIGMLIYVFEWIFVGNGIPWYGIGMFLGFAVCVEVLVTKSPTKEARILAAVITCIAIGMTFSLRQWQFGMQQNLYEFAWGKASAEVLREMTIPDYDDITDHVIELSNNPDRPFLYRMGTFITYFVPRNLEVIPLNDNQLGFFNCLNQEQDHKLTLRRLQALGFHSIIFDTNTATIEKDSNGTLHQKVKLFLEFANDTSLGIQSIVNNPGGGVAYMILP